MELETHKAVGKRSGLEYNQSGILCLEAYTDEDWENYGSSIALEPYGSAEYWKWVSENCYEEHMRRQRNYMKPFMQDEQNMEWIWSSGWKFERKQYEAVVTQYQESPRKKSWLSSLMKPDFR